MLKDFTSVFNLKTVKKNSKGKKKKVSYPKIDYSKVDYPTVIPVEKIEPERFGKKDFDEVEYTKIVAIVAFVLLIVLKRFDIKVPRYIVDSLALLIVKSHDFLFFFLGIILGILFCKYFV